jgi:quinol monooxygenase YgiN
MLMAASYDQKDETKYFLYERWKDEREFWDVQMKKSYRIPYNQNIAAFEAAERKVSMYTPRYFKVKK